MDNQNSTVSPAGSLTVWREKAKASTAPLLAVKERTKAKIDHVRWHASFWPEAAAETFTWCITQLNRAQDPKSLEQKILKFGVVASIMTGTAVYNSALLYTEACFVALYSGSMHMLLHIPTAREKYRNKVRKKELKQAAKKPEPK